LEYRCEVQWKQHGLGQAHFAEDQSVVLAAAWTGRTMEFPMKSIVPIREKFNEHGEFVSASTLNSKNDYPAW
jgi:putative IMPACT (imprinted ancient) family translation regulator